MKVKAKYEIIEDYLKNKIKAGELVPGDKIESADELGKRFSVSYLTVNKALMNLTQEGYLERIQGSGSFVKAKASMDMMSFIHYNSLSDDIRRIGKKPGSKLVKYEILFAENIPDVADLFSLKGKDKIHSFTRVRYANDEPIAISYSYISAKLVPVLDVNVLDGGSLMLYLQQIGFPGTYVAYRKLFARMSTQQQEELLALEGPTPLLLSTQISITEDGNAYNYVDTYYVTDRYEYTCLSFPQDVDETSFYEKLPEKIKKAHHHTS